MASKTPSVTPIMGTKTPRGTCSEADDDGVEPAGLAEAVRRLDDRLSMQRREAAALDELLRSELEVQRRQQSLTSTTLQTIQDRLQSVEERTDAMRSQLEDTLREGSAAGFEGHSTPGGARFETALTNIAEAVREPSNAGSATGDDIHRRIKALSAKMAQCQDKEGGNTMVPIDRLAGGASLMISQNSGGTLDILASSRGASRGPTMSMQDTGGGMFDALNMPQAISMMEQQQQEPAYSFRQPSMERGNLQSSPLPQGSPTNSRGLYAYRQLSPSAQTARGPGGPLYNQRQLSPGASQRRSLNQ